MYGILSILQSLNAIMKTTESAMSLCMYVMRCSLSSLKDFGLNVAECCVHLVLWLVHFLHVNFSINGLMIYKVSRLLNLLFRVHTSLVIVYNIHDYMSV